MAAAMFDGARALMRAALGDADGTDHSPAMRAELFLRTVGCEFDIAARERIAERLRSGATQEGRLGAAGGAPGPADRACLARPSSE